MATPWKHPRTGVYWFRKAVPARLRSALSREFKRTLDTKDPEEAKRRFPRAVLEYEALRRQAEASQGSTPDLEQLARQFVHDNAKSEGEWEALLVASRIESDSRLPVDENEEQPQAREVARPLLVKMFGSEAVERNEIATRHAAWSAIQSELENSHTLQDVLDGWLKERKPVNRTELEWRTSAKGFGLQPYVGSATKSDVVAFKDRLIEQGSPGIPRRALAGATWTTTSRRSRSMLRVCGLEPKPSRNNVAMMRFPTTRYREKEAWRSQSGSCSETSTSTRESRGVTANGCVSGFTNSSVALLGFVGKLVTPSKLD